jgi:hypothetical protein
MDPFKKPDDISMRFLFNFKKVFVLTDDLYNPGTTEFTEQVKQIVHIFTTSV